MKHITDKLNSAIENAVAIKRNVNRTILILDNCTITLEQKVSNYKACVDILLDGIGWYTGLVITTELIKVLEKASRKSWIIDSDLSKEIRQNNIKNWESL
jgi:hypothetical protein